MSDDLLSVTQAAQRLGLSVRRVRALIDAGRLPAVRVGSSYVLRAADVAAFVPGRTGRPKGKP